MISQVAAGAADAEASRLRGPVQPGVNISCLAWSFAILAGDHWNQTTAYGRLRLKCHHARASGLDEE